MSWIYWTTFHKDQILTLYFGISAFVIRYLIHSEDGSLLEQLLDSLHSFMALKGLAKSNS